MNEEINKKDYKVLYPFKGWILENFPFIEADFDAVTNYELMCKVTEYLNNVIYNQNQVQDLSDELVQGYNDLLNYVNTYFENLDVQNEVNIKLDNMATDGTLTDLIKGYVDPFIDEQNDEIDAFKDDINSTIESFDTRLSNIASGSPLVASSTSGMTDTTRVYVNTSDGKWYYYDGDSWEIGGTYQATQISDNEVSYPMLNETLQENIKPYDLTTNNFTVTGQFASGSVGNTITYTNLTPNTLSGVLDVEPNDYIVVPFMPIATATYGSVKPLLLTDNADKIIAIYNLSDLYNDVTKESKNFTLRIPSNVTKVYYNCITTTTYKSIWYPYKVTSYNYIDSRITNQLVEKEEIEVDENLANIYSLTNWNIALSGFSTNAYLVNPLEKINIVTTLYSSEQFCPGIFVDDDGRPCGSLLPHGSGSPTSINMDAIVPAGAKKLYIANSNTNLASTSVYKYKLSDIDISSIKNLKVDYISGVLTMTNLSNNNYITMQNFGGNNLFMIKSYKVGTTVKSLSTDMIPAPYIVNAVNNANGDRTQDGFTGGNHQWNNQGSGSSATASQVSLNIYCDGIELEDNTSVYCNNVKIIEVNNVQGNNTCLEIGGGRSVLQEKIVFDFDGKHLKVKNTITPLEDIVIRLYYGIQTAPFNNDDYKVYADKLYDVNTQYTLTEKPFAIYGSDIICSKLSDGGLGDYKYNNSFKVNISNGKSYYCPISNNTTTFTTSDINYIEGEYIFDDHQI